MGCAQIWRVDFPAGSRPGLVYLSAARRAGCGFRDIQYGDVFAVACGAGSVLFFRRAAWRWHLEFTFTLLALILPVWWPERTCRALLLV